MVKAQSADVRIQKSLQRIPMNVHSITTNTWHMIQIYRYKPVFMGDHVVDGEVNNNRR